VCRCAARSYCTISTCARTRTSLVRWRTYASSSHPRPPPSLPSPPLCTGGTSTIYRWRESWIDWDLRWPRFVGGGPRRRRRPPPPLLLSSQRRRRRRRTRTRTANAPPPYPLLPPPPPPPLPLPLVGLVLRRRDCRQTTSSSPPVAAAAAAAAFLADGSRFFSTAFDRPRLRPWTRTCGKWTSWAAAFSAWRCRRTRLRRPMRATSSPIFSVSPPGVLRSRECVPLSGWGCDSYLFRSRAAWQEGARAPITPVHRQQDPLCRGARWRSVDVIDNGETYSGIAAPEERVLWSRRHRLMLMRESSLHRSLSLSLFWSRDFSQIYGSSSLPRWAHTKFWFSVTRQRKYGRFVDSTNGRWGKHDIIIDDEEEK